MAGEPRHIARQAVGKPDLAHMKQTDADRRAAAEERAAEQFGDVQVTPDVYPDYAGDTTLESRDQKDLVPPNGEGYRDSATTADDHQSKVKSEVKPHDKV